MQLRRGCNFFWIWCFSQQLLPLFLQLLKVCMFNLKLTSSVTKILQAAHILHTNSCPDVMLESPCFEHVVCCCWLQYCTGTFECNFHISYTSISK